MSGIDLMGGFYGFYGNLMSVTLGTDLAGYGLGSDADDETAMYNHLVRTRDVILASPQMFKVMKNPLEVARMLDYAIRYWDTPMRDEALGILANEEQRLISENVIVYPHADLSGDELGELNAGFFKKVGNAVKKVATTAAKGVAKGATAVAKTTAKVATTAAKGVAKGATAVAKTTAKVATTAAKGVATAAKATGNFVLRFNPVSLAARGGMLMALRLNLFKLADKLQYGLYTDEQAQAAHFNMDAFHDNQAAYNKSRNLFCNTLRGKEDKFRTAVKNGVKRKAINGLGGLSANGVGAVAQATIAAAMGFITTILTFFKGKKDPQSGEEWADENPTEGDLMDIMDYDEDGNPINAAPTTANQKTQKESKNFWQKTSDVLQTGAKLVNDYLPYGGGSSIIPYNANQYDNDYGYDTSNQQDMIISPSSGSSSAVTAEVMTGGMMSNIGAFIKKNAVLIGVGAAIAAGGIYFLNRKKKSSRGLSDGVRTYSRPTTKRRNGKSRSKNLIKPMKLS